MCRKDNGTFTEMDQCEEKIVLLKIIISNGNRTEWSPIRSVIIRVIRELTNRRLSHDDAVGLRDIPTAHACLGTCRRRVKVNDVGKSHLPAS